MTSFDELFSWVHPISFSESSVRILLSDGVSWLDVVGLDQNSVAQLAEATHFCAGDLVELFPDLGRFDSHRLIQVLVELGAVEPVPQLTNRTGTTTLRVAVVGNLATATRFRNRLNLLSGVTAGVSGEGRFPYWVDLTSNETDLVVAVSETAEVDRGISNTLVQGCCLQLPVVIGTSQIVLGPLISPGSSACLGCLDRQLAATDPDYPVRLAQSILTPSRPSKEQIDIALEMVLDEVSLYGSASRSALINRRLSRNLNSGVESMLLIEPHPACFCQVGQLLTMAS